MALLESTSVLNELLEAWQGNHGSGVDQVVTLTRIAELVEKETEAYLKMDPDPFDDRHPIKARPDCSLGLLLKALFRNEDFMNTLANDYIMHRDDVELQKAACRLMLDILPGLETSVVFNETEGLVQRLFKWVETSPDPLQSYATGLLAAAMDVQDIVQTFKEQNSKLVPVMLKRLKELRNKIGENSVGDRPFAHLNTNNTNSSTSTLENINEDSESENQNENLNLNLSPVRTGVKHSLSNSSPPNKRRRFSSPIALSPSTLNECSNSSWAELEPYMIGSSKVHPLTDEMKQRFMLQYLTPMGDYQELLCHVFENNALNLILHYINLKENHDIRLAFDALKYLASLLCHKKFALEFLNSNGLQQLLQIYRPSVAATGVSICLYYLAYNEDAMEKICLLPKHILNDLVTYALWLLECSHDSSRCHATMFFSLSFPFKIILEIFDSQDGLRKLLNVIFMLDLFSTENIYTEDELFTKRQNVRHVCMALKRYYETHLIIEAEQMKRSYNNSNYNLSNGDYNNPSSPSANGNVPPYKAARFSNDVIKDHVETLLDFMPIRINWKPVDELLKFGGIKLLIQLIAVSFDWNFTGKAEAVRCALDVLVVCSVTPKCQLALTEDIPVGGDQNAVGMRIILAATEGEIVADPDCQRSALNVIINCVCGPVGRLSGSIARLCGSASAKKRYGSLRSEDLLAKMWDCVRVNNGIMILLNLLMIKTPITDADSIRALTCKALCGLARSETAKQIIGKLPLFTNGQLQGLMKEPILQDKRTEHVKFCKYCMELVEKVTGAPVATNLETCITNINKAEVVAQTRINFNEKELLQLIHQHLVNKGLTETASTLQREASLPAISPSLLIKGASFLTSSTPIIPQRTLRQISTVVNLPLTNNSHCDMNSSIATTTPSYNSPLVSHSNLHTTTPNTPTPNTPIPIRLHRSSISKSASKALSLRKHEGGSSFQHSPILKRLNEMSSSSTSQQTSTNVTLDSIVTEYLRKQHYLCKNPVVTCPPFDLFVPHRCPEPLNRGSAPVNLTMRLQKREWFPRFGGNYGSKMDRKFIYSRFRPIRTYRDPENSSSFSSCAFSHVDQFIFLGAQSGELNAFNLHTGSLEATYSCHESEITHIEPSRDGRLILTSSTQVWRQPHSALWTFTDIFEMKLPFREDQYVEFGKQSQDKVLGTKYYEAHLYDLTTGALVNTYHDENYSNKYAKNRATFHPSDDLILNDGVLWDTRCATKVHKFDKFNQHINGVFHPNGQEIISNSEIWDIKTFHLLSTVPALDQCRVKFNKNGDVIYGAVFEEENSEDDESVVKSPYGCSFRTFDGTDYSNIATIDVKRSICDLAVDPGECFIALVESNNSRSDFETESVARLFEIGRSKEEDDEEDDEEEEEEDNDVADEDDSEDEDDNLDNTDDFDLEMNESDRSNDDESNSNEDEEDSDDADDDQIEIALMSDSSSHSSDDEGIVYQIND